MRSTDYATHEGYLDSFWRDKDGHIWRTVAVITEPAVIIEPVDKPIPGVMYERETHVIGSPNMTERFVELRPVVT